MKIKNSITLNYNKNEYSNEIKCVLLQNIKKNSNSNGTTSVILNYKADQT